MFSILTIVLIAIFGVLKVFLKKTKDIWETVIIVIAFVVSIVSYFQQRDAISNQQTSHEIEIKKERAEMSEIKTQNDTLKNSLNKVYNKNDSLISIVSDFRRSFNTITKRQDSIFEFMTGGDNLPLVFIPNLSSNEIHIWIENYGKVPLRDVNYIIRNPKNKEVIDERVPTLAFQRSIDVYKYVVPADLDSCEIECTVIWPGIKLRAYNTYIRVNQLAYGIIKVKTSYTLIDGKSFNPFKSKALFFPKATIRKKRAN